MYARISTLQGPAEEMEAGLETTRNQIVPAIKQIAGFKGIYLLGDRSSGKSMAMTLWESEDAMRESREAANRLREQAAEAESASIASVEEFEVLMHEGG